MHFSYTARTKDGQMTRGTIEAVSRAEAEGVLADRGYLAVVVNKQRFFGVLQAFWEQLQKPKTKDVVIFLRQFSVMVSARVPIVVALRSLVRSTVNPALRAVMLDVVREVESGVKLSDAFAAHPHVFSDFAANVIRAGETTGRLDEVLGYLADQAEHDEELRGRVRGAMLYPAFILSGLVIVGGIMMVVIIPKLTAVIAEGGGDLPTTTRILIATSGFLAAWWWLIVGIVAAGVIAFRYALRYPIVRSRWDVAKLYFPIFGRLTREVAVVRFTRSFEMLLRGGVDIVPALEVVRGIIGNAAYGDLLDETIREVKDGNSITTAFLRSNEMPPMVSQLLAVGEETGQLQTVLAKLSEFYAREVDQRIRNLVTIIEPVIMVVMGLAVGIMVAAVIMPMYNMASQF